MQRESTVLDFLTVTHLRVQLGEYFRVNIFSMYLPLFHLEIVHKHVFAGLFVIQNDLHWVKLKFSPIHKKLIAAFQRRNSVWSNLTQRSQGVPSCLNWIILWFSFLMWISIIHLNFNILVVFDAIIMVYAVSANISVQILLVRKFTAWKLKPRKCRVPFKIQMNIHKSITVFASLWCLVFFIHPKLEGYKLRHDTSREQLNEELGRLSYKMIVKLLDILGLQSLFERWEKIPLGVMYKTSSENRTFRCKLLQEPWSNVPCKTLQTGVYGAYWDKRNFSKFNFLSTVKAHF